MGHYDSCRESDYVSIDTFNKLYEENNKLGKTIESLKSENTNLTKTIKILEIKFNTVQDELYKEKRKEKGQIRLTDNVKIENPVHDIPALRTDKVYYKGELVNEIVWLVIEYDKNNKQHKYFALDRLSLNFSELINNDKLIHCIKELVDVGFDCDSNVETDYYERGKDD